MSNSTQTPNLDEQDWAQASERAKEAVAYLSEMANQAARHVGKMADDLTASAGAGIQGMGDTLSKNTPHAGVLGIASQAVAGTIKDGGEYLEDAKLSGMTKAIAQLIRQNPIPVIVIGIGVAWFAWRKLKS